MRRSGRRVRAAAWAALTAASLAATARAHAQDADVRGRVLGPGGAPVQDARAEVTDRLGALVAAAASDAEGWFVLRRLAGGDYWIRALSGSLRSPLQPLAVRPGVPVEPTLYLAAGAREEIDIVASAAPHADVRVVLAGETVRHLGGRLSSRALQTAIATAPGWSAEDNGLLHFRGVDDGFLYVLDGVPVYERIDPLFGLAPGSATIGSVRILNGYVPPEYGLRAGGVIDVRSAAADSHGWGGRLEAGAASFETATASGALAGPVGARGSLMGSVRWERSGRFLDPVHPQNLHNTGSAGSGEAEYLWAGSRDVHALRGGLGRSSFDVPHDEEQEEAGQDQRQRLDHGFATWSWQRAWSGRTASHAAFHLRRTSAELDPSPGDTPLTLEAERMQRRAGLLFSVTHRRGAHTLKAGVEAALLRLRERFRFAVLDTEEGEEAGLSPGALERTPDNPFDFRDAVHRPQVSLYVQDSWRAADGLTVEFGLRFDHTRLLLHESALGPRLGVSYRFGGGATAVRASVNRFYQPPQTEHLLLASSAQARELSPFAELGGGADVPAERQTAIEAGVERTLGPLRLDLAVWQRRMRSQADPNVLFGTNIVFPNSVARSRAEGLDLRVELPRRGPWSAYLSYTLSRVVQFGPINGGLFLEDDFLEIGPGVEFTPDHDQRHVASAALTHHDERRGWTASLAARYQSGTPVELPEEALDELASRPGVGAVDLEEGRVRPSLVLDALAAVRLKRWSKSDLSLRASVLNLADEFYAYNFGNPFSGTHFGAPRALTLGLVLHRR